jgi:hypothetical protein
MATATTEEQEQLVGQTAENIRRQRTNYNQSSSSTSQQQGPQQIQFPPVTSVSFVCGLLAGAAQAGVFNPWDRALYLSVKNQSRFLSYENFERPYQGFLQSIGGRALSAGLYFPLEQTFMQLVPKGEGVQHVAIYNFVAGTAAGAANALILNPLSAIKYKTWGREVNQGMFFEAAGMLRKGGVRPFFNGMAPTVLRDVVFGGFYTFLRLEAQPAFGLAPEHQWMANVGAAAVATVASGPFNLARNVQYATHSEQRAPTIAQVLANLVQEIEEKQTWHRKWHYLQERLRIGTYWPTSPPSYLQCHFAAAYLFVPLF